MSDAGWLLVTLLVYMVALLVIGVIAQRRTRDHTDFYLGGRRVGALVAAVGASASSSSAWTLLGVSGAAYAWGVSAVWLFPACVGGFCLNWYVLAPSLRRHGHATGVMTVPETLSRGFDARWRRAITGLAAVVILVSLGAYVASQFQGAGKTFEAVFDVPPWQSVTVGAVVVLVYILFGGFWAVSLTDTVQGLVMAGTALVLPLAALVAVGGPSGLVDGLAAIDGPGYLAIGGPRAGPVAVGFAVGLLGIGLGYPGQPHVVKFFMAMRDDAATTRRAQRIAVAWAVVIYSGMLLLGWCGRILHPDLADKETVFVVAVQALFHPALGGIMLAAVLSAMMSTADSQLLVASSTVIHDLGLGGRSERTTMLRSRVAVFVITLASAAAALVGGQEIFSRVLFGWAAMGAAFGPLLIVRVTMRLVHTAAATFATMLTGFVLSVGAHNFHTDLFGTPEGKGLTQYVVPWVAALLLALACGRREATPER